MLRPLLWSLVLLSAFPARAQESGARAAFAEPGLSPDGTEIAFASGGDIWTVPATGGTARLLVAHAAHESRPLFSPDGQALAFVSTRTGNGDVYVLDLVTGNLTRLTYADAAESLDGWAPDGQALYFSSPAQDLGGMHDVYRVGRAGGPPVAVAADRYVNEFHAAPAPQGDLIAIGARGTAAAQWWRRGGSHISTSELYLVTPGAPPRYRPLSAGGSIELWPMWSPDARTLYNVSSRSGTPNLWARPVDGPTAGTPRALTSFTDGRVLWPSISRDGRTIAFERGLEVWTLDLATGSARAVPITLRGAAATAPNERLSGASNLQQLALSPDGKKVAFVMHGEVFSAAVKDGGEAARVTTTAGPEAQVTWAPDSRRLAYVSSRTGTPQLVLYRFDTRAETVLTQAGAPVHSPAFSPDGRALAYVTAQELRVLDLASGRDRLLATAALGTFPIVGARAFSWSPDGRWLAYLTPGDRGLLNAWLVPATGGPARQASFVANTGGSTVTWSPDGQTLYFGTGQRTEPGQIARVDLVPRTPRFREDLFRDLFREATSGARADSAGRDALPAPRRDSAVVWTGLRQRLSLLPLGLDAHEPVVSPDGKWLVVVASSAGQENLYAYPLDELSREAPVARQLTSAPGEKRDAQFSPDSKEVFYLDGARPHIVSLETRQPRPLAVSATMEVDFSQVKQALFLQAWTYLRDHFYDPAFHGVDWEATRAAYAPFVAGAQTPAELRRILSLMVGELDASHLGVSAPPGSAVTETGHLGLRFDEAELARAGRLRVAAVVPLGPADVAGDLRAGDLLTAIDGVAVGPTTNLDALLAGKIGRRVELTLAPRTGTAARTVAVRPVNAATERALRYRQWVETNRAYVAQQSGGRLGYVHLLDMSAESLQQLYTDLDAENLGREGVVVDVRNNNGGFVNAYALDVFARQGYLTMTTRGLPAMPMRTALGQRALERPTVLVTNRHSLSDAEDFTEGYRALGLGKVVGEPTAGWIIYTWNTPLFDGTVLRLPRTGVTTRTGENMEHNPRPVDLAVDRPVGESYAGTDTQLDAAVRTLLQQIDTGDR